MCNCTSEVRALLVPESRIALSLVTMTEPLRGERETAIGEKLGGPFGLAGVAE